MAIYIIYVQWWSSDITY